MLLLMLLFFINFIEVYNRVILFLWMWDNVWANFNRNGHLWLMFLKQTIVFSAPDWPYSSSTCFFPQSSNWLFSPICRLSSFCSFFASSFPLQIDHILVCMCQFTHTVFLNIYCKPNKFNDDKKLTILTILPQSLILVVTKRLSDVQIFQRINLCRYKYESPIFFYLVAVFFLFFFFFFDFLIFACCSSFRNYGRLCHFLIYLNSVNGNIIWFSSSDFPMILRDKTFKLKLLSQKISEITIIGR